MDGHANLELERPRSAWELIKVTFALYRRLPLLFLILAAGVMVPYWLVVLALTGAGPETERSVSAGAGLILTVVETALVGPLISALHVHAVDEVREGRRPVIGAVARRGLAALPVVSAAVIVAAIGSFLGLLALIIPGVLLYLGWAVVAQTAALEDGGWVDALRRSRRLTRQNYEHVFGTLFLSGAILLVPTLLIARVFRQQDTTVASFLVGTAFMTLTASFSALVSALLFFDLRARLELQASAPAHEPNAPPRTPNGRVVEPTGHPLDPDSYSDTDRPHGWYVVPDAPWKMRYWPGDGADGFSKRRAKTPKATQAGWYKVRD